MQPASELVYETAMAIDQGQRERQEDAVVSDFQAGQPFGFVVLADGMGGHAAGDVASKIVVTEVFSELKLNSGDPELLEPHIGTVLRRATDCANECVGLYARRCPNTRGMGATLLAPVFIEDRLYWISVGDSPLYLFRDGALCRLNDNHALESQIDYLVSAGIMTREEALSHPDQTCLTSVLIGGHVPQVDCRTAPVRIRDGDILIVASDGLQFLEEDQIEGILRFSRHRSADAIGSALMRDIHQMDDPAQDNVSLCVVKVMKRGARNHTEPVMETPQPQMQRFSNGSVTILAKVSRARKATG